MVDAMSRAVRKAAAIGIAGALALMPLGIGSANAGAMLQLSGTPGEAFALLAKLGPHSHRRGYAHDGDRVRMRSNRRQSRNFHALLLALPPSA